MVVKTVIAKQYPPLNWLQNCPDVKLKGDTVGAAIVQSIEREAAIKSCNVDKKSLRDWVQDDGIDRN